MATKVGGVGLSGHKHDVPAGGLFTFSYESNNRAEPLCKRINEDAALLTRLGWTFVQMIGGTGLDGHLILATWRK